MTVTKARGAPLKLDEKSSAELLTVLRMGNPFATAAEFAGVDNSTLTRWRQRGQDALAVPPGKRSPTQRKFADFYTAFSRAVMEANVRFQSQLYALGTKDLAGATPEQQRIILDAIKFYLTHRDPSNYSTQQRMEVTGADGGPVAVSAADVFQALKDAKAQEDEDA